MLNEKGVDEMGFNVKGKKIACTSDLADDVINAGGMYFVINFWWIRPKVRGD